MYRTGDEFLARAGFAEQEDGRGRRSDLGDGPADGVDCRACADEWSLQHRTLLRQRIAHELLVVSRIHALVRECRMAPDDGAAEALVRGVEDFEAVDLLVALWRELRDDQMTRLPED